MTPEADIHRFQGRGARVVGSHVVRDHMLLGAAAALLLSRFAPVRDCVLFWLATVFVDVDHYFNLLFWSRFRCFSVPKLIRFYGFIVENRRKYPAFLAIESFHTAEFLGLLALSAYGLNVQFLKPVLWGVAFHIVVDFFHLTRLGALKARRNSFIEFFLLRSALLKRGLDPTQAQRDAAAHVMGSGSHS